MNWVNDFNNFYRGRGKIQQLAELAAVQALQAKAAENQRNSEAESAYVRRNVWGHVNGSGSAGKDNDDDMATTILGDVTVQQPQRPQPPSLWPIAAMMLAGMVPVAGVGGAAAAYLLTRDKQPPPATSDPPEFEDSSVSIGLGRIDDYLKDN